MDCDRYLSAIHFCQSSRPVGLVRCNRWLKLHERDFFNMLLTVFLICILTTEARDAQDYCESPFPFLRQVQYIVQYHPWAKMLPKWTPPNHNLYSEWQKYLCTATWTNLRNQPESICNWILWLSLIIAFDLESSAHCQIIAFTLS